MIDLGYSPNVAETDSDTSDEGCCDVEAAGCSSFDWGMVRG